MTFTFSRSSRRWFFLAAAVLFIAACSLLQLAAAHTRSQRSLGGPLPGLTPLETVLFNQGGKFFSFRWTPKRGLGPVFMRTSCVACHSEPDGGGNSKQQVTLFQGGNSALEGGPYLQQYLSIPGCPLGKGEVVPTDATVVARHQVPQTFGAGLINSIPDSSIQAQAIDKGMGIHGAVNIVLDEIGHLRAGHFGYKAQYADLIQNSFQDMDHFLGVTTVYLPVEDPPNGNPIPPGCLRAPEPNDDGSGLLGVFHYEVYLDSPTPGSGNSNGQALFTSIGCALCHLPTYTTAPQVLVPIDFDGHFITSAALSNQPVNLYSDLLLHDLGPALADGIVFGQSTGSQFRTAPLWGLGSRLTTGLLHDGRAADVRSAINFHQGEATEVIANFNALSASDQADLLAFVDSL